LPFSPYKKMHFFDLAGNDNIWTAVVGERPLWGTRRYDRSWLDAADRPAFKLGDAAGK
jgi:hypothetical protein